MNFYGRSASTCCHVLLRKDVLHSGTYINYWPVIIHTRVRLSDRRELMARISAYVHICNSSSRVVFGSLERSCSYIFRSPVFFAHLRPLQRLKVRIHQGHWALIRKRQRSLAVELMGLYLPNGSGSPSRSLSIERERSV